MNPEPLKNKIRFLRIERIDKKENVILGTPIIYLNDLEQAVKDLLKDLKKMHEENLKDLIWKIGNPPTLWYEDVVDLIKKRFGDFDEKD